MSAPLAERRTPSGLVAGTIAFSSVDGPGNRFVVFLQGCNFDCVACHNPYTIQACIDCPGRAAIDGDHQGPQRLRVPDLLHQIGRAAPFIRGITVSGGEATLQAGFVEALFRAVKEDPALAALTCFIDSNGAADPMTWDRLAPLTDGVMVDLKSFDPEIHHRLTGQGNADVLASIRHLHHLRRLHEVRLLLLAGWNDDPALIRRTGEWLATVDPTMRVKVIGFRLHGARPHDPPLVEPTAGRLQEAAAILRATAPFDIAVI